MRKRLAAPAVLVALALALSSAGLELLLPRPAGAWGAAFTDLAEGMARSHLSFSLEGIATAHPPGELVPERATELHDAEALADAVEEAVDALSRAFARGDPASAGSAFARLVETATDLWQPLETSGTLDPPGTARGFHFRYETLLAARVLAGQVAPLAGSLPPEAVADVASTARAIASQRAILVPLLAEAELRARTLSGGLYDDVYYQALAEDLGPDIETALRGAAGMIADLVHTAWVRSGRSLPGAVPPLPLTLRALGVGSGSWEAQFFLERPSPVSAVLYTPAGRRAATLHEGPLPAGFHRLKAGLDRVTLAAAGVYFLRLEAGQATATAKIPLFR